MKINGLPEFAGIDVFAKPSFIFDLDSNKRQDLITRYRATVCTRLSDGFAVRAWQKSIYRFGGLYRQVPIAVTVSLDAKGLIKNVEIDAPSRGSQGKSCDFACLESSLRDKLTHNPFTELSLRHNAQPVFGKKGLPESIDADISVSFNGKPVAVSRVKADDFAGCYSGLNRCFTRAYHAEKKFFEISGKQRFSNLPSLVWLVILALSHEGMSGTLSRAAKLENILIFLQTGEGREGCIGFRSGLNMNQRYLLGAVLGAIAVCVSAAAALCLKRRV